MSQRPTDPGIADQPLEGGRPFRGIRPGQDAVVAVTNHVRVGFEPREHAGNAGSRELEPLDRALGPVVTVFVVKRVVEKAKKAGLCWALVRNLTTPGASGYYSQMMAKTGFGGDAHHSGKKGEILERYFLHSRQFIAG